MKRACLCQQAAAAAAGHPENLSAATPAAHISHELNTQRRARAPGPDVEVPAFLGQVQSTMGTKPLQEVASAGRAGAAGKADPCLWFQLYVLTDRPFVRKLVLGTPPQNCSSMPATTWGRVRLPD